MMSRPLIFVIILCASCQIIGMAPRPPHEQEFVSTAESGNFERVQTLWRQHEELYRYTHTDEQALLEASEHGHNHIILFLIANGVDARTHRDRALYNAAQTGNKELVILLCTIIQKDMSYSAKKKSHAEQAIANAYTIAAYHGQLDIITYLHPLISNESVRTLAQRNAAFFGSAPIVAYLKSHETVFHASEHLHLFDTPLHAAALNGHVAVAQLLLDEQTSVDELSDALLAAKHGKHDEMMALLCAHGINLSGKRPTH